MLGKKDSLISIIKSYSAAVCLIQESKVTRKGQIKIPGYQLFEIIRQNSEGGSLLTAIHDNLNPIFISGGETDDEILVVQANFGNEKCRFINAYGPQESEDRNKVIQFYSKLDQEIKNAKILGCLIFIEMDANAKLGPEIIPGDPLPLSPNGLILKNIIESNNLVLCNSDEKCEGLYTRERNTIRGNEKSIIDFMIICEDLYEYFEKMKIEANNVLCKYAKSKTRPVVTRSDHNLLIGSFQMKWVKGSQKNHTRREIFNYNDTEGWKKFKYLTTDDTLSKCIKGLNIEEEGRIWLKKFKKHYS